MTITRANTILRKLQIGGTIRTPGHFERTLGRWVIDRDNFQAHTGYETVERALVGQIEAHWETASARMDSLTVQEMAVVKAIPSNVSRLL